MYYVIDRFEEDMAVCEGENGEILHLPREKLGGFHEGEGFLYDGMFITVSPEKDEQRRAYIRALKSKLFRRFENKD